VEDNVSKTREWKVPFSNFDNILWSIITFFELATLEGWPSILLRTIVKDADAVVYFPEVMWPIFYSIIGSNEEKVQNANKFNTS
jgi:hypothetical protein